MSAGYTGWTSNLIRTGALTVSRDHYGYTLSREASGMFRLESGIFLFTNEFVSLDHVPFPNSFMTLSKVIMNPKYGDRMEKGPKTLF